MRTPTVTEIEMLTFFEVEPSVLDQDARIPWIYNSSSYEVARGDLALLFTISPSYGDLRISLKSGEVSIYELDAKNIENIEYHNDKGREALRIALRPSEELWLRIKPSIAITQDIDDAP